MLSWWIETNYKKVEEFTVIEMSESEWWRLYNLGVKRHSRENYFYRRLLTDDEFLQSKRKWNLFGNV